MNPPTLEKIPHTMTNHNDQRVDNYFWLRDKDWPKVADSKILDYLKAENQYAEDTFKPYTAQYNTLYQEILARIKLEDRSVPIKKDNYDYYQRTEKESNYPI